MRPVSALEGISVQVKMCFLVSSRKTILLVCAILASVSEHRLVSFVALPGRNVCQNGIHTSDGTSQVWLLLLDGTASFRSEDHLSDSASAWSADLALLPVRKTHHGPASAPRYAELRS